MVDYHNRVEWTRGHPAPDDPQGTRLKMGHSASMFVHHSAGLSIGIDSLAEQRATVRAFWHQHVRVNGWADIGYNFVLFPPHGLVRKVHIWGGRGWDRVPASQQGCNTGNWSVCVAGNFEVEKVSHAILEGLQWIHDRAEKRGIGARVKGHRDCGHNSECPGDHLYALLGRIR